MKPEQHSSLIKKPSSDSLFKRLGLLSSLGLAGTVLVFGALSARAETETETEV